MIVSNYSYSIPKADYNHIELFVRFVLYAHDVMELPFENIFSKMKVNDFLNQVGTNLGNYDEKLVKNYLM